MSDKNYIFNEIKGVTVKGKSQSLFIDISIFKNALNLTNKNIDILKSIRTNLGLPA